LEISKEAISVKGDVPTLESFVNGELIDKAMGVIKELGKSTLQIDSMMRSTFR
jgi:hypothetical protein